MSEMQLIAAQFAAAARNRDAFGKVVYNVKDYGVKGDGDKNDTGALNEIIKQGSIDRVPVIIPSGYYLADQIVQPSHSYVFGQPGATIIRNSSNGGSSGATVINENQNPGTMDSSAWDQDIIWSGCKFTTLTPAQVGKHFAYWGVKNLRIEYAEIFKCYADWQAIFRMVEDVRLLGNYFHPDGDDLFTDGLHFNTAKNVTGTNNIIYGVDDALACTIENANDGDIRNIVFTGGYLETKKASVIKIATFRPAWAPNTARDVKNQVIANGKIYEYTVAGVTGLVPPSHASGTAADGTATCQFVTTTTITSMPAEDSTIDRIIVSNVNGKGGTLDAGLAIWIDERSRMKRIRNVKLSYINIDASQGAGSGMEANGVYGLQLDHVSIIEPQGTGIVVRDSEKVTGDNLWVENPRTAAANGMSLINCDKGHINNSQFDFNVEGNTSNGILVGTTDNPTSRMMFMENAVSGAGGDSYSLQNSQDCGYSWNRVIDGHRGLIEYSGSDKNVMENNFLSDVDSTTLSMNGPNSRARGNVGYSDEKHNPFTVPNTVGPLGLTLVSDPGGPWDGWYYMTVNHGLSALPANSGFDVAPTSPTYGITKWIVDPTVSNTTTFRVYFDAVPDPLKPKPTFRFWANTPRNF